MPITEHRLKEYLALYGTEMEHWPAHLRAQAMQPHHQALLTRLTIEQLYAEEVMLSHRPFEKAHPDLAARIISAARTTQRRAGFSPLIWLQEFLSSVFPRPGVAVAAMLTLGIVIGFGLPAANNADNTAMQPYMEDDGNIL